MIVATVTTSIAFEKEEFFLAYLETEECRFITSFPEELRASFDSGKPVIFTTPRPKLGCITCSEVKVERLPRASKND